MSGLVKFNVNLSSKHYATLEEMAAATDGTMADVGREALSILWWLAQEYGRGNRLVLRRPDGDTELYVRILERAARTAGQPTT